MRVGLTYIIKQQMPLRSLRCQRLEYGAGWRIGFR